MKIIDVPRVERPVLPGFLFIGLGLVVVDVCFCVGKDWRTKECAVLRTRFLKRSAIVSAVVVLMLLVNVSGAFAEEISIESLVNNVEELDCVQNTSSESLVASALSSGERDTDYKTVTTQDGSVLRWKKDGTSSAKIVGYESLSPNLVVPSSIEGLSVIGLADMAVGSTIIPNSTFSGAKELESVVLPDSVSILSGMDFSDCVNLKQVSLGNGIKYIGMASFSNCSSLESIDIPDTCKVIGQTAFMSCTSLKSVHLSAGITQLGAGVFGGCSALTSVDIPAGVTEVGGGCFEGCGLKTIQLPKGLKTVANTAFRSCPLEWAYVPSSVKKIGDEAFDSKVLILADSGSSEARNWARRNSNVYIAGTLDDYSKQGYIGRFDFTGHEHKPEVTLRSSNYDVFPMEYANVEYRNNINAGTATCVVTSNYVQGKQERTFDIKKIRIYNADFAPIETQIYRGQAVRPKVSATYGDYSLIEGVDFTCSYDTSSKFDKDGHVTVVGRGNFEGDTSISFSVERAPVVITFESNGGTAVPPFTAGYGSCYEVWNYIEDNKPTNNGYRFLGWYKDPELKQEWDYFHEAPTSDMTVYAKWDFTVSSASVHRFAGSTRYETSEYIVNQYGDFDKLVLVSGENYPDALSASALAGALNAPIALTPHNYLSSSPWWLIKQHQPKEIIVVGGPSAINDYVLNSVKETAPGAKITRIWGNTRYETAVNVCRAISDRKLSMSSTGIIASGQGFADALSAAPYSASNCAPILLSGPDGLSKETLNSIKSSGLKRIVIVGGRVAVPESVENQLRSCGIEDITRLAGDTRYETSAKVADFIVGTKTVSKVFCAAGNNFPDALSAGPLAAQSGSPILLVDESSTAAQGWLGKRKGYISDLYIAGGSSAVSDSLANSLKAAAGK